MEKQQLNHLEDKDMNEFKTFITFVLGVFALILTIAASVGAIEYGIGAGNPQFYAIAGVCNLLGWGSLIAYNAYKLIKSRIGGEESSDKAGAKEPPSASENKTDEMKIK